MIEGPELILGLVGAVGTDLDTVEKKLSKQLQVVNYECIRIKLSRLLPDLPSWGYLRAKSASEDVRYHEYMTAGNRLRESIDDGAAMALLGIGALRRERRKGSKKRQAPRQHCTYVLRSLKHPAEAERLRDIYGKSFLLISAFSPREIRKQNLVLRIAQSRHDAQTAKYYTDAEKIMGRDEGEETDFGQAVRETYPKADVFIDTTNLKHLEESIVRFMELYFGNTFHTPTRDEYAMFHAQAAALRSAELGRQVGAVISTKEGNIVAVGTNEVPKSGGGLYWAGDMPDRREFCRGYDANDRYKRSLFGEAIKRLQNCKWLTRERTNKEIESLITEAFNDSRLLRGSQITGLIEFGRSVHAEMAAIVDAACRGVSIANCTLYTTTFPCHLCAKHIVAAGISEVVYIEPYPKSRVPELYPDSVQTDSSQCDGVADRQYVKFRPFVGVSPRRYMDFFTMLQRKDELGNVIEWKSSIAMPRYFERFESYTRTESKEWLGFHAKVRKLPATLARGRR